MIEEQETKPEAPVPSQEIGKRIFPLILLLSSSLGAFFCGLTFKYTRTTHGEMHEVSAIVLSCLLACLIPYGWSQRARWWNAVASELEKHTNMIESLPTNRLALYIVLAAGLGLYAELMMVRLHATMFQLFAHFKNVSLLSCFLGLGIGYALNTKWRLSTPLLIPLLAFQIVFLNLLVRFSDLNFMLLNPTTEQATMGLYPASSLPDWAMSYGLLLFVFVFNATCFIPLGQLACRLMERMDKLSSYGWNLIGSLLGIVVIAVLSFLWSPPVVWFAIAAAVTLFFVRKELTSLIALSVCSLTVLVALSLPLRPMQLDIYSPYQILTLLLDRENLRLYSNNTWSQSMLNLSVPNVANHYDLRPQADYYDLAYHFKPAPADVLIVGGGTGNDVATALRNRAQSVDVVEIDPGIIEIGKGLHPENPYGDARVTVINDDARSYIRHTIKHYDLIVYGLLDSATTMSGNSAGMRMDSYVWTVEAFKEARARLRKNGVIAMAVCMYPQMGPKVTEMLRQSFDGMNPYVFRTNWDAGFTFIIGEGLQRPNYVPPFAELTNDLARTHSRVDVSTDDWPFLFMFERAYPFSYAAIIGALLALSLVMVYKFVPETKGNFSLPCFFLGAGFMLVEAKSITELALVYGSTWFVTSIVIASILLLAYLANAIVSKLGRPFPIIIYGLLALSLLVGVTFSIMHPSYGDVWTERIVMTAILTLPIFFSGFAFSSELARSRSVSAALSSNLLGGMLGGFLEYNSMYFGYRSLYCFALVMYLAALITSAKQRRGSGEQAAIITETKVEA